jgi:RNA polymerase sigma-70 factor (ECF subfamily)
MDKQLPNEELMVRIAKGDEYAFQILVERHQTSLLNLIYRFLGGDRTKSQDLAQEVFLRVWQAAGGYKPKAKFSPWLFPFLRAPLQATSWGDAPAG